MNDPSTSTATQSPLPDLASLQDLLPQYEMQTVLGRGGMGAVYRARHRKLDRIVAIKFILPDCTDPEFAVRFEREARALGRLSHPGIVSIHDFGEVDGQCYLVMEFVDGASLRDLIQAGRMTPHDALQLIPQLCDALQYAHDQGVVHRDIKPENVLIEQDGTARIADFGLAKVLGQDQSALGLTRSDQAMGTPHYMAPEQIGGAARVDHRADIYSLGVMFYEMLTGELPIGRFGPPSGKSKAGRSMDDVVMKSLASEPERRYQKASDVKRDLQSTDSRPPRQSGHKRTPNYTRKPLSEALAGAVMFFSVFLFCMLFGWFAWHIWLLGIAAFAMALMPSPYRGTRTAWAAIVIAGFGLTYCFVAPALDSSRTLETPALMMPAACFSLWFLLGVFGLRATRRQSRR